MWETRPLATLGASTACNRDIFTFFIFSVHSFTVYSNFFLRRFWAYFPYFEKIKGAFWDLCLPLSTSERNVTWLLKAERMEPEETAVLCKHTTAAEMLDAALSVRSMPYQRKIADRVVWSRHDFSAADCTFITTWHFVFCNSVLHISVRSS
jgi:hypothetical protein